MFEKIYIFSPEFNLLKHVKQADLAVHSASKDSFCIGTSGKESACQCRKHKRCGFNPWVSKIP